MGYKANGFSIFFLMVSMILMGLGYYAIVISRDLVYLYMGLAAIVFIIASFMAGME